MRVQKSAEGIVGRDEAESPRRISTEGLNIEQRE